MTLRAQQARLLARASAPPKKGKPVLPESTELIREQLRRLREGRA